jgi:hypothetical protein
MEMGDEFDDVDISNPFSTWSNVPPRDCSQGSPEIAPNFRRRLVETNPHQVMNHGQSTGAKRGQIDTE